MNGCYQANGEVDESPANNEDKIDENKEESNGNENVEENGSEDVNATIEPDAEADADQEHLQLTVADSDKLDTSNVDNEDSLNLTIGEDEAKIFQEEVMRQQAVISYSYEMNTANTLIFHFQEADEKVKENSSK